MFYVYEDNIVDKVVLKNYVQTHDQIMHILSNCLAIIIAVTVSFFPLKMLLKYSKSIKKCKSGKLTEAAAVLKCDGHTL